ncbi:transcriptional regulator [Saccharothrix australiensis]|uniref:Transcriptional regulator n=1 Tax=Saccharothrix australiensis TaxID=2072 RepID=A0A495WB15_9PSEU|nr:transcriptional regulator [Saccharothrix australiensis]RKT57985.1 hypothetical protein C8E97_6720 [Saccharothrix australiensis]
MKSTIRLKREAFRKAALLAGYTSVYGLAQAMNVNRSNVMRVLEGTSRPGIPFIAGTLRVLKPYTFEDLFEVVTCS